MYVIIYIYIEESCSDVCKLPILCLENKTVRINDLYKWFEIFINIIKDIHLCNNLMSRYVKQLCFFFTCLKFLLKIHFCGWKPKYVTISLIIKGRVPAVETIIKLILILPYLLRMYMPYFKQNGRKQNKIEIMENMGIWDM